MSKNTKGYVYILSNESFPGLFKIGASKIGGHRRSEELYSAGVPTPFILEFEIFCDDAFNVEAVVHDNLECYRHNNKREFFKIELQEAILEITSVCFMGKLGKDVVVGKMKDFMVKSDICVNYLDDSYLDLAKEISIMDGVVIEDYHDILRYALLRKISEGALIDAMNKIRMECRHYPYAVKELNNF